MDFEILEHDRKLVFVQVYEKLYGMITDGKTFPVGTKLPSEPKLAEMLGVSRMTLRQALALLNDDGLLLKIQGKGNFVKSRNGNISAGIEKIGNPIYKSCKLEIEDTECDFRLEVTNGITIEMFKRNSAVSVAVDTWYKSKEGFVAYTLTVLPIETVTRFNIDLNSKDSLFEFVKDTVYKNALRIHSTIQISQAGDFISDKYKLSSKTDILLLVENIYCDDDYAPVVCNKHYLIPEFFSIEINTIR